jgi:hypothetical protein
MARKTKRQAAARSSDLTVSPPVAERATVTTSGNGPFLLMGNGYQMAANSDARGYIYWPSVDTRRQINQWTRSEIARRAQFLYAHFGFARKLVNGMARILGYLTPQPNTSDEEWNELAFECFMAIAGSAEIWDRQGRFDFFQGQLMDNIAQDKEGDCLAVMTETPGGRARLAYYEAHQLVNPPEATGIWVDGVKLNGATRHIAYGIRDGEDPTKVTVVNAADAIYFGRFENRGQVRPLSALYAACINMTDVLEVRGFQKAKIKQSAQKGHVVETEAQAPPTSSVGGFGGVPATAQITTPDGQTQNVNVDILYGSAVAPKLAPGQKLRVITDDNPSTNNMEFEKVLLRDCAASVDLSYERLCDIAGITGPGVRILNQDEIRWKTLRLLPQAKRCQRMWNYVIAKELKSGRLRQPKLKSGEVWWNRCEWIGLPDPGIDGGRDARATVFNLQTGLTSYLEEAKTGGLYWKKRAKQVISEVVFLETECIKQCAAAGLEPGKITPERAFPMRFATAINAIGFPGPTDPNAVTSDPPKKLDGDEPDPSADPQPADA